MGIDEPCWSHQLMDVMGVPGYLSWTQSKLTCSLLFPDLFFLFPTPHLSLLLTLPSPFFTLFLFSFPSSDLRNFFFSSIYSSSVKFATDEQPRQGRGTFYHPPTHSLRLTHTPSRTHLHSKFTQLHTPNLTLPHAWHSTQQNPLSSTTHHVAKNNSS